MAAPAAANVLVASPRLATGGILTAATGTALPTTTTGSLTAFTDAGYIGEDGVTMTIDRSTEDIFAWGGAKVRVITTEHSVQLAWSFLEVNTASLGLVFGTDNVSTVGDETTVKLNGTVLPHFALVIAAADGDVAVLITAADAQVAEQEDVVFVHSAPTEFGVTVECFPDANGDKAKIIRDLGTSS